MTRLSLLTVSRCEPYTARFFTHFRAVADILGVPWVLATDRCDAPAFPAADTTFRVTCNTVIEDVLADAHRRCNSEWVLRLDDDETISPGGIDWLCRWMAHPVPANFNVLAVCRANLWGDERTRLDEEYLWPDLQCRLIRAGYETRDTIHAGLPPDEVVPWVLLHHKFVVKSRAERVAIAERYEATRPGCGLGEHYVRFSLPENLFGENPRTAPL